jgi:hypothetical protein
MDADWVNIYGSRTIFITLIFSYLLYTRHYSILMWGALFGIVMPVTDGILAYQADAPFKVVLKHIITILYLVITFFVLNKLVRKKPNKNFKRKKYSWLFHSVHIIANYIFPLK